MWYDCAMMSLWAVLEQNSMVFHEHSKELLGELMDMVRGQPAPAELCAVVLSSPDHKEPSSLSDLLAESGVRRVYWLEHQALAHYTTQAYTDALAWLIQRFRPQLVATGATPYGRDWTPRLAARLHLPFAANCLGCDVRNGSLWSLQSLYEGRAYVQSSIALGGRCALVTLLPGMRGEPAPAQSAGAVEIVRLVPEIGAGTPFMASMSVSASSQQQRVRSLGVQAPSPAEIELEAAERIVAGGRGVGREGFAQLAAFAQRLGAAVGATRVATDLGWVERERQIGSTGKTVRPGLYIACGISGAAQHTSGMSAAQTVIAINPDRSAPIFALADLGLLGDANQILPLATQLLDEEKS